MFAHTFAQISLSSVIFCWLFLLVDLPEVKAAVFRSLIATYSVWSTDVSISYQFCGVYVCVCVFVCVYVCVKLTCISILIAGRISSRMSQSCN